ncbi:MAG: hypothetical protein PHP08_01350 [Candidatus Dojkabacteria bacterium]|nr:hypothetical protein [Candidatus Dojkabacteria bacterium]
MDQQKKKSKKTIKVLLIFLAILILGLIGAVVYFYLSGDIFQAEEEEEIITCGCYYVDPQVTNSCTDTQRAFKFNTSKGTLQECSATCSTDDLSTSSLYSTTPQDSYLICTTKNIPSTACSAMEITTEDGLIVTGKIQPDETILVTATFDSDSYTDPKFLINNVPTEPDTVNGNVITKTISDLGEDNSTLQISAQAINSTGDTVTSIICKRLIEITTTAKAGVSSLVLDTYTENNQTKVLSAIINAAGLEDTDTTVKFSFENNTLTMTDGFELDPTRGRISITEVELYDEDNFSGTDSFALLSQYTGEIEVTAEIIQDSNSLGSATTTITLDETEDTTDQDTTDTTDSTDQDTTDETTDDETTVEESLFSVSKTSSETCLERVSPDNTTTFTITVTNERDSTDTIESIKDKLPLGFTYVSGSSKLNGNAIADSVFVTTTDVGESQEIVWAPEDSWSITSNGTLTIEFNAIAGSNSLTGDNLNEVIVTPTEIPEDPSTLRASVEVIVAQDCDDIDTSVPQTGIFDTTIGRIAVGIGIILIGIIIYNTNQGNKLAHFIINTNAYKDAEMTSYKIFNPKRYFEEKILQRRERKR